MCQPTVRGANICISVQPPHGFILYVVNIYNISILCGPRRAYLYWHPPARWSGGSSCSFECGPEVYRSSVVSRFLAGVWIKLLLLHSLQPLVPAGRTPSAVIGLGIGHKFVPPRAAAYSTTRPKDCHPPGGVKSLCRFWPGNLGARDPPEPPVQVVIVSGCIRP